MSKLSSHKPRFPAWLGATGYEVGCFGVMISSVFFMLFYWITFENFAMSMSQAAQSLYAEGISYFFLSHLPRPNIYAVLAYIGWTIFQAMLYISLPGPVCLGQYTPSGRRLGYRLNGLFAWATTLTAFIILSISGLSPATFITDRWEGFLWTVITYGLVSSLVFYVKGLISPSNPEDNKVTGHLFSDMLFGIEFHPRIGTAFDMKHFHSTRAGGMIIWNIMDLTFATLQYTNFGYLSDSICLLVIFRLLIVLEFFVHERWFIDTFDIAYEHFGFYYLYGYSCFMPVIYSLQTQFLSHNPVELSDKIKVALVAIFAFGLFLSTSANYQKTLFRETQGQCIIWGRKPEYIECEYISQDGNKRQSLLLTSGWWGLVRHANYLGNVLFTFAMCATCGFTSLYPWTEALFVTGLVIHRCYRDEKKCLAKYGPQWEEYCRTVPWRLIPGVI